MTPFTPLGPAELAARWGVTRQRVHQIVEADDTLRALTRDLSRGRVWNLEDIEAWERARTDAGIPLPGTRPTREAE